MEDVAGFVGRREFHTETLDDLTGHADLIGAGGGELALAGLANLFLWLGWLRSSKTFGLHWHDLQTTEPADGPLDDLPVGCGVLHYRLLPETKSSRTKRADLAIAYATLSGY